MKSRFSLMICLLGAAIAVWTASRPAVGDTSPTIAASAQSLEQALNSLAMRAHLQIVFRTELAERVPAKTVPTGLPPEKELRLLLEGTGLRFQYINARTIAIDTDNSLRSVNMQACSFQQKSKFLFRR